MIVFTKEGNLNITRERMEVTETYAGILGDEETNDATNNECYKPLHILMKLEFPRY